MHIATRVRCEQRPPRGREFGAGFIVDTEVLAKVGRKAGSWGRAADRLEVEIVCLCSLELQRHGGEGVASRHESMVLTP